MIDLSERPIVIILRLASFVATQARPIFDGGRLSIADSICYGLFVTPFFSFPYARLGPRNAQNNKTMYLPTSGGFW